MSIRVGRAGLLVVPTLAWLVVATAWAQPPKAPQAPQAPPVIPPHVVDCNPKPFAANVSADLKEISVTFDRPLAPTTGFVGLRFLGLDPTAKDAQPKWDAAGTTCALPVQLAPDVTYALSVNTSKERGFADTQGTPAVPFAWVFATGARTDDQLPPRVVKSDPPPGATDANFRLRKISVTFSRPVAPGDFSWVQLRGCGEYPGVRGGALTLSDDRLTATIDVRLNFGTVYALSINDLQYPGYKDTFGRPVVPYGWWFKTAD